MKASKCLKFSFFIFFFLVLINVDFVNIIFTLARVLFPNHFDNEIRNFLTDPTLSLNAHELIPLASIIVLTITFSILTVPCISFDIVYIPFNCNLCFLRRHKPNVAIQYQPLRQFLAFLQISFSFLVVWYHPLFLLNFAMLYLHDIIQIIVLFIKLTTKEMSRFEKVLKLTIRICLDKIFIQNNLYPYPSKLFSLWYFSVLMTLSLDIHPNPGPPEFHKKDYKDGFLSFCNWNLNSLSKNDFYRITLLEAHNTIFNYDLISLCETSLNGSFNAEDIRLSGYKFFSCNNPDGSKNGGVGLFYKEHLPLRIRHDLCFDECLVTELQFDNRKIFFTVLYRNPSSKAKNPKYSAFLNNFKGLYKKNSR